MFTYIFAHIIVDTLYFPFWWYTRGFVNVMNWSAESMADIVRIAGLKIWLKSMFKPMFQDYSKEGRIISFIMRVVLLLFKLLMISMWGAIVAVLVIGWLLLPLAIVWFISISFGYDFLPQGLRII